ncbi:hypothetical protein P167DRAFT_488669 [Morchella conica CCBAS932]|uniref:Saccharopine dehydrogenase NADP binding domain-containing protein n=1 Tax=Morchella conica CCBAS932 TaxID=1392247 RepID=A0A3N4KN03_9PEZI|nr:hypothetical protein P167DRAFT_488669 [Morchella conica CCBAS932]
MSSTPRTYDLIIFGATGYTGKLTSKQILLNSPTTLKWAIAGRSSQKLELLATDYNTTYPDRQPVETFVSDLSEPALDNLTKSTCCLISTVGPYLKYGTPVVAACARNGTHYVDSTGETPWVKRIIEKYHEEAKKNGAILIPQCGVESAPAELSAYALVKFVRDKLNCGVREMVYTIDDLKGGVSGGTAETALSMFEHCSLSEILTSANHYSLSPVPGRPLPYTLPFRRHPTFGYLTMWIQAIPDTTLVYRGWGLHDEGQYYGKNFEFREYKKTRNFVTAILWVIIFSALSALPFFAPIRWLTRKFVTQPGDGPTTEQVLKHRVEWRGIAEADDGRAVHQRAYVSFRAEKDCYELTGILLALTALSILFDEDTLAKKIGGGVLTPSTIATERYFKELEKAGVFVETKMLDWLRE